VEVRTAVAQEFWPDLPKRWMVPPPGGRLRNNYRKFHGTIWKGALPRPAGVVEENYDVPIRILSSSCRHCQALAFARIMSWGSENHLFCRGCCNAASTALLQSCDVLLVDPRNLRTIVYPAAGFRLWWPRKPARSVTQRSIPILKTPAGPGLSGNNLPQGASQGRGFPLLLFEAHFRSQKTDSRPQLKTEGGHSEI
jgi:hypothetical protein